MKTNLIILAISAFLLFSCDKDSEEDQPSPQPSNPNSGGNGGSGGGIGSTFIFPATTGSYWIYEWYRVDFDGESESQFSRVDSLYISGDTTIAGIQYAVFEGSLFPSQNHFSLQRDSSGYVVTPGGGIVYSSTNFTDTLSQQDYLNGISVFRQMYPEQLVSVPAGNFAALEARETHYRASGEPLTLCGDQTVELAKYYSSGIGLIKTQLSYSAPLIQCTEYMEGRLIDYYISPE